MIDRAISTGADSTTSEFPILGDSTSPVTTEGHPSMRSSLRFSFASAKHRLTHSPLSQTQSSSASLMGSNSLTDRLTMMNIPTQDLKGAVFYGWLWKRGQSFKTWKKRFFLLHGSALTYYTQCCVIASDVLGGGTHCLDLPVRGGVRVVKAELSDLTSFGLKITSSSGRALYVQAGDQHARTQWLEVLNDASDARRDGKVLPASSSRDASPRDHHLLEQTTYQHATALSVLSSEAEDEDDEMQECEMQGDLYIRLGLLLGWKKRFVTYANGLLSIRPSRSADPRQGSKPVEVLSAVPWNGHAHGICIRFEQHKEMYVYTEHDVDAAMWLSAFKSQ